MPLLDHFHERRDPRADWRSFQARWSGSIADELDRILPRRYFAWLIRSESDTQVLGHSCGFGVQVRDEDLQLVAFVKLARPPVGDGAERRAWAVRCTAYLQQGIGLALVDAVKPGQFSLHDEMIALAGTPTVPADVSALEAAAFRPVRRQEREEVGVWRSLSEVGDALPTLPPFLRKDGCVPLDLEATCAETRRRSRLT